MATTAITNSFKTDLMQGGHCLNATQSGLTATGTTSTHLTALSVNTANLSVGMAVTGTNITATVISLIVGANAIDLAIATTGAPSAIVITGDVFKILLIKSPGATGTYDATLTNVGTPGSGTPGTANVGTDEVTGTGYTTGGFTLTNVNPALSSTTAVGTFSVNPNWTSATFATVAGVIYNSSTRQGASATPFNNHTVSIHDFGGPQSVSSGTLTLVIPTANSSTGLLRIA